MANVNDVVESIEETKTVIEETGKDVSANIDQVNTILEMYQPLVEKLVSWIGYGLSFIGALILINVILIVYLVVKRN